ncbi:tRNA preQ1(34) S-adenosylmethionine ribosyltransferase-isomerase QueA [Lichenihabitans sp. Uapishka_5]|uniref:tRNA preQ1(34) S-adenosylmethionine ribosyltransferase-isomerase QueA n=1 Tax=Lichenihabitans sp. Uapishka_5 TaxID=3037302 RepID=UPI0029E7D81C|nr:tRNA preQ1(34) S-adenosylmethionine ribosyltransferase-isomerase QueA [Lichenihabitans sp. Uapishka_5]MDX7952913.1 tRNA preQ1(34) S-adenosylmethionine ribosyltransferase-isomerase QueA [Lichenihabitans sp. Uapishka_5]
MLVDAFDFALPDAAIALHPAQPRDAARLLAVMPGASPSFADHVVRDLPGLLRAGDAVVVNDTRVIPARLIGRRYRGEASARIEVTLHLREATDTWRAFLRPSKKLVDGETLVFGDGFAATRVASGEGGEAVLRFDRGGPDLDAALDRHGLMPLPPYIAHRRPEEAGDADHYQTMFAREPGAVAAPTAGLHFTPDLLTGLEAEGVAIHRVTLHVGAGTFLPVKVEDTADHRMHAEWGRVTPEVAAALNATRARGGRIVSVGTTALRILESATTEAGTIAPFAGQTAIFITPGYRFRAIDLLMTNFHLPRSTLFMLVSAFSGLDTMQAAYAHAITGGYRFYSYGDACLLGRHDQP